MANRIHLQLDGIQTLSAALRSLPEELRDGALEVITDEVDRVESAIRAAYPTGPTGNLKAGLVQERANVSNWGAGIVLKNKAPHAFLFETGSEYKHPGMGWVRRTTGRGKIRAGVSRGRMPAGKIFIPAVIRARARMREALIRFVERAGFRVAS